MIMKSQISVGPHRVDPTTPVNRANGSAFAAAEGYGVSHCEDKDAGPKKEAYAGEGLVFFMHSVLFKSSFLSKFCLASDDSTFSLLFVIMPLPALDGLILPQSPINLAPLFSSPILSSWLDWWIFPSCPPFLSLLCIRLCESQPYRVRFTYIRLLFNPLHGARWPNVSIGESSGWQRRDILLIWYESTNERYDTLAK